MTTEAHDATIAHLSDRALYRRSEEMLFDAARLHCSGRRSGLRKRVRRYLKPYRRDRVFLTSLASSIGRLLVVAYLMAQLWATEANAQALLQLLLAGQRHPRYRPHRQYKHDVYRGDRWRHRLQHDVRSARRFYRQTLYGRHSQHPPGCYLYRARHDDLDL